MSLYIIRGAAFPQDRYFGLFLEKLQLSRPRDVLLISTKHPLIDLLRGPPKPMENGKTPMP